MLPSSYSIIGYDRLWLDVTGSCNKSCLMQALRLRYWLFRKVNMFCVTSNKSWNGLKIWWICPFKWTFCLMKWNLYLCVCATVFTELYATRTELKIIKITMKWKFRLLALIKGVEISTTIQKHMEPSALVLYVIHGSVCSAPRKIKHTECLRVGSPENKHISKHLKYRPTVRQKKYFGNI